MKHSRQQYRRQPSLDSVDEEEMVVEEIEERSRRRLVDYTVSKSHPRLISKTSIRERKCASSPSKIQQEAPANKLILPSFNYLNKAPYGSPRQNDNAISDEERIDFFLKVKRKRASATTKIDDFRAGLQKSRSQKSILFGSFLAESGARRSSYVDLKQAMSKRKGMCALTF